MLELVKLVFTVPKADADEIRKVVGDAGGGIVGNYIHCSFSSVGIGRYMPKSGAKPTIGSIDSSEEVAEERVEMTCDKVLLPEILTALRSAHPYEEPAIDIYPLITP